MLPKQVFIVEDEGVVAADIEDSLKLLGYDVIGRAASGEEAVEKISKLQPDIVLMDIILRGPMDGIKAAEIVHRNHDIPIVFLTSHADNATVSSACVTQPFGYILKPYDEQELRVTLEIALYRHRAEAKLRKMERWLTTTLESIGDGVITTDTGGQVTFMNPKAEQLTGWSAAEARGQALENVFSIHNAYSGQPVLNPVLEAIRQEAQVTIPKDTLLRTRDGHSFPVDDSASPIRDKNQTIGAVLVFRDCIERVRAEAEIRGLNEQLEHRVRDRTAELLAVNKELESFSYSVAHDLRAPLRAINGFSAMLAENYTQTLDSEGNRLLKIVCDSARRMGHMVDDFLNLARVGRQAIRMTRISMDSQVQSVLSELQCDPDHSCLHIEPLPETHGDGPLLRQVWANLLSNAIKFSRTSAQPRIEVGGREDELETTYWVRDNGVGFPMEYHDRLFETFQRLHPAESFEGTGVGLAIVRKIVERHGGRIWAESQPGAGAIFYFTVPRMDRPSRASSIIEAAGTRTDK